MAPARSRAKVLAEVRKARAEIVENRAALAVARAQLLVAASDRRLELSRKDPHESAPFLDRRQLRSQPGPNIGARAVLAGA